MGLASAGEIRGITAIERTRQIGLEGISALTFRRAAVAVGMTTYDVVKALTIGSCHILDIADILQAALNLKRCCTGLSQCFQIVELVHVA